MGSGMMRLLAMSSVAVLLAGCEDPVEPDQDRAFIESQGRPGTSNDPQAGAISPTQINLSWPDNSNNETGWEIHRSTAGREGAFSLLAQTPSNVTIYSDVGLNPTTEYCYRVRSFKTSGRKTTLAAFSTTTCATTLGPPSAPSNTSVTPGLYGVVDIVWITTAIATDGFRVERAASGEGPWVKVETLPASVRTYQDVGRAIEQQVCYRIIAYNAFADAQSNVDCTTPPAAPGSLVAKSTDEHNITLTWGDASAAEDGFELQRAGDAFVWSVIATLPANVSTYDDGGLAVDTRYWYRVRATKDGGFSQFSYVASAITVTTPPAPPSTTVSPYGSSVVTVNWTIDLGLADKFRVERSTDNEASWSTAGSAPENQSWFYDEGRSSEQRVCYRVFASNRVGESPASNVACTTPPAAPTNLVTVSIDEHTVEHQWTDNSGVEDGYGLWLIGFDGWDYYYYPVSLPPNTTSYQASSSEGVYGVVALKDGGYSDWALPAEVTAAALQNRSKTASRPPASAQRTPPVLKKIR